MLEEILSKKYIELIEEEGMDITTRFTPKKKVKAEIFAKESGLVAGIYELKILFNTFGIKVIHSIKDGDYFKFGDVIFSLEGDSHKILVVERTALNILSRMSGIATTTRKYCEIIKNANSNTRVAATRKTTPFFRYFEKKAVEIGGGYMHRLSLEDCVMIKNNHLRLFNNDVEKALKTAKEKTCFTHKIEIEVESKEQALKSMNYADIIMFDNMRAEEIKESIKEIKEKTLGKRNIAFEASGGINMENIEEYAKTGVDVISLGALTHSYKSIDFSLKIIV